VAAVFSLDGFGVAFFRVDRDAAARAAVFRRATFFVRAAGRLLAAARVRGVGFFRAVFFRAIAFFLVNSSSWFQPRPE
jgi:hypothetical protein